MNSESIWYAYAVATSECASTGSITSNLNGEAVVKFLDVAPGIIVLASEVPAVVFEENASPGPGDPAWLAEAALAHHAVVLQAHQSGDVLPLRFGTIFSSLTDLLGHFGDMEGEWRDRLSSIAGCEEYELNLEVDSEALQLHLLESRSHEWDHLPTGRRYLAQRSAHRQIEAELSEIGLKAWENFEAGLGDTLRAVFERDQATRTYLVKRNSTKFFDLVEKCSEPEDGLRFNVSGVWPPYSFAAGGFTTDSKGPDTHSSSNELKVRESEPDLLYPVLQ